MQCSRTGLCVVRVRRGGSYLCLNAVQPPEPKDLPSTHLHLGMVNLICSLCVLLIVDVLLRGPVACLLQERQAVCRDRGDQL